LFIGSTCVLFIGSTLITRVCWFFRAVAAFRLITVVALRGIRFIAVTHKPTGHVVPVLPAEFSSDEYARTEDQCGDENRSDAAQDHSGDPVCSV
jgi:hypothetical protein